MNYWEKLGGNNINIEEVNYLRYLNSSNILEETRDNKEVFEIYDKFISISADLIKKLSLPNNSISMAFIIGHLIKMGIFSYNNKFIDKRIHDTFSSKEGIDIVLGRGVCRHFAFFQRDIFNNLDIFNQIFSCKIGNYKLKEKISGKVNHLANVIEYDNNYYVYDSYNLNLFKFVKPNIVKDKAGHYLYYKVEYLMWDEYLSTKEVIERLQKYKKSIKSQLISDKDYYEIKLESFNNLEKNVGLIENFTEDTKDLKEKIIKKSK